MELIQTVDKMWCMGEKGVKSEVNSGVRFREFHSEGNLFGSKSPANSLYFKIDANTAAQ